MKKVLCQSCGISMKKHGDFGTNKDGKSNGTYCRNCFQGGFFTNPHSTMQDQMDKMISREMSAKNISEYDAKKKFTALMPTLDRWKNTNQKSNNFEKINLKKFLLFGGGTLIFVIVMYIFAPEGTLDSSNSDSDNDSSSMIPIWIALFVTFVIGQKKKQWKNKQKPKSEQQKRILYIILGLTILLVIGSMLFWSLQK